jgi:hypothetical protein
MKKTTQLFRESLRLNRSEFIDYFLRAGFDARNLSSSLKVNQCQKAIVELYEMRLDPNFEVFFLV